jgi:hypothetical protein
MERDLIDIQTVGVVLCIAVEVCPTPGKLLPRAKIERTLISINRAICCGMAAFLLGTTFTGQRRAAPRSRRML